MPISSDRKFLHDLASPLTSLSLTLKRIVSSSKSNPPTLTQEQILERLEKCVEFISHMEMLHANQKSLIAERQNQTPQQ